ncbi:MAG TPA: F0F1 ATP synthase subunit B [Azospirillaceae bacterium]|nr:F0F1 ATP synthase subunit B [Azospirillaceae bacterium]
MLSNSNFWVAIAFVIFIVLAFRPAAKTITTALDDRAARIRRELEEAQRLREEAQRTLAEYQRKQRDAMKEAEAIVAHARDEAARLRANASAEIDAALKRREQQAMDKIAQAEASALAEVRDLAVDIAVQASREILEANLKGTAATQLVDDAIANLPGKLH